MSEKVKDAVLESAYGEEYYGGAAGNPTSVGYANYLEKAPQRSEGFRLRLRRIGRYASTPGSILDVGCAIGLFLKVAKEEGWQAKGYERSAWAVDYGRRVFGLDIELGSGESDPFPAGSFDVVTLWDVIEHVEHPRNIMGLVRRWLKEGGIVALTTINASSVGARLAGAKWRHLVPPHHLQFFSRGSVMRLLHDTGFRILSCTASGTCLKGRGDSEGSALVRGLDDLLCYWRFSPIVTALNLLDEIEIIAAKD